MTEAVLRSGTPLMIEHTPAGGNLAAGQIILLGNTGTLANGIAHSKIENGKLGHLAVGGGIYEVKVASNYAAYSAVFWDDTNSVLTTTSTNMSPFGYTLEAAAAANAVISVLHDPRISLT